MSKYRNVFGEIEFELDKFFVQHRAVNGKYSILKHEAFCITDPIWLCIDDDTVLNLWDTPPLFDSFIQAVAWLKIHVDELL